MEFTPDKRDATIIKVIDGRKRRIGTIQNAAGTDGDTESRVIITKRQANRFTGSNDIVSKGDRLPSLGRWDNVNYAPRFRPKWEDKHDF